MMFADSRRPEAEFEVMRTLYFRLLSSVALVGIVVFFVVRRELAWTTDIGLRVAELDLGAMWLLGWLMWMYASERLFSALGVEAPERLPGETSRGELALRLLAMVVLAPLSEELVFRGLLFNRLVDSPVTLVGAISIPALLFAVLHLQYGWRECLWILLDGLLFGLARAHTETLLCPMLMHMTGNAHAYLQRLPR